MSSVTMSPGTCADDATVGTKQWGDDWAPGKVPNNAKASDGVYAEALSGGDEISHYLKATNFGFAIPSGATINGILVEIEKIKRYDEYGGTCRDNIVSIVKADGTVGSTNKAITGSEWSTIESYVSYGSSSDLWGETWDASKINDVDFGVVLSAHVVWDGWADVDHIQITIYYTETPSVVGPFPTFFQM